MDPYFFELYEQGGLRFSVLRPEGSSQDYEFAVSLFKKGLNFYQNPSGDPLTLRRFWTHPVSLKIHEAYTHAFLRNDWRAARIAFLEAAELEQAPLYLKSMKEWLSSKAETSEIVLKKKVLQVMYRNAETELLREKYKMELEKIK